MLAKYRSCHDDLRPTDSLQVSRGWVPRQLPYETALELVDADRLLRMLDVYNTRLPPLSLEAVLKETRKSKR